MEALALNLDKRGEKDANQDYPGLHRVQAEKLRHHQEQAELPGQTGNEQVLQILPEAHGTQGNQIGIRIADTAPAGGRYALPVHKE